MITSLIISSTLTVSNTSNNDIYSAALPVIDFSNPQNESTVGDIVSLILEAENEDEITDYEIYID
ncbi:MAG: hypothetical protein KAR35_05050, partial [Candidatus Heimdallarchaeota archaeon]|nr:hypothetical protein [Candidatus Heimdallarchaeota archaeon]